METGDVGEFHGAEVKGPEVNVLKAVALQGLGHCGGEQGWGGKSRPGMSLFQELSLRPADDSHTGPAVLL